jgi:hypothetical protein
MIGFGMDPGNVGGGLDTSEVSLLGIFAGMPELRYLSLGYGFGLDARMWNGQELPAFSTLRMFCYRENVFAGSVHSPFRYMKNLTCLRAPVNSQMDVIADLRQLKVNVVEIDSHQPKKYPLTTHSWTGLLPLTNS